MDSTVDLSLDPEDRALSLRAQFVILGFQLDSQNQQPCPLPPWHPCLWAAVRLRITKI